MSTKPNFKTTLLMVFIAGACLLLNTQQLLGQASSIVVKGTVSGPQGPLSGVSVRVEGGGTGVATGDNGAYTIQAPANGTLVFTSVGYAVQRIPVNNQTTHNVVLSAETKALEEVVVVGYGTQRRGSVTGSVGTVSGADIANTATTGVGQAIQGKVSGVQITRTSGQPGAGVDIRIRGEGTLNSGKGPLVIVDGVEGQDLNTISPKDIESITVLKDASASAIYGSRAANGVIVVTTRRGAAGKTVVGYSYVAGASNIMRMPRILGAKDFARLQNEARINSNAIPTWSDSAIASFGEGTNWLGAILETGIRQEHNVSFSGGTDKIRYLLASNYLDDKGIVKYSFYKRITGRVNLDIKMSDRFTIGLNAYVYNTKSRGGPALQNAIEFAPTIPLNNPDGTPGYRLPGGPTNSENGGLNPLQTFAIGADYTNLNPTTGTNSSVYIEYAIRPFLKFRSTGGLNLSINHNKTFDPSYSIVDPLGVTVGERLAQNRRLVELNAYFKNWIVNNVLTFTKTYGDHNTSALLGHSEQYTVNETNQATRTGFPSNDFFVLDAGSNLLDQVSGSKVESSLRSFFGRVNYDYKRRYLLELVGRYDGSSRFSPRLKYGFFPSASVGWRISDEAFFDRFKGLVNDLKLRASYGAIGNEAIPNFVYLQNIGLNNPYFFNNTAVQGAAFSGLVNPDIKWETSYLSNIGLDIKLLKNRVTITLDAYNKLTKDILTSVPVPSTTGNFNNDINAGTQVRNVGQVRNKGIELFLEYSSSAGKDIRYSLSFTGSYNKNEVVSLGTPGTVLFGDATRSVTKVGYPIGSVYGYRSNGVWQSAEEISKNPHQANDQPGDLRLVDLNGDGVVDGADREPLGSSVPKYTMGINGDLRFKNFDFNVSSQGDFGRRILRYAVGGYFEFGAGVRNNFDYVLNRWHGPGTSNLIPRIVTSEYNTGEATSLRVQDASYFKIRHIELGYTLPRKLLEQMKMANLRIYIAAENPFLFTPFVGLDPERPGTVQRQNETYPQAKTLLAGINLNF
ncbi:TonB-dependent receptor [Segetibacter sp. 3557_3]|uniref:SusC/RagA family TonB-linked outer membrane protein n=1 Tax=Segetibacter sp. 3557_3 TaxID=2547429 RepID=UPI001058E061|nr:TonB-dependent receptor [Segetibacter sp. 3557_3]TDH20066.1 TonB-dependent receptor [Segetibacter sp. 3557_3]